jgi:hypothetical protein
MMTMCDGCSLICLDKKFGRRYTIYLKMTFDMSVDAVVRFDGQV